jgi:hypothetical protein
MMMPVRFWRFGVVLLLTLPALGCADGSLMSEPVGIGSDRDELKKSPCACFEIPQRDDQWRRG